MTEQQLAQQKLLARQQAKQRLLRCTKEDSARWGLGMLHALNSLPAWHDAGTVLCFASIGLEPDTRPILNQILQSGRTLCLPRQTSTPGVMDAHLIRQLSQLQPGLHGIPEPPEQAPVISPQQIDLILAPCLAAAPDGTRLGHGGGYYDRFFAQSPAFRAVLCPHVLVFDHLPAGPLDLTAHCILTETGVL